MRKKYTLAKGQNIVFDVPEKYRPKTKAPSCPPEVRNTAPASVHSASGAAKRKPAGKAAQPSLQERGHSGRKNKSAERNSRDMAVNKLIRTVALAILCFSLGMLGNNIYGYMIDLETDGTVKNHIFGSATPIPTPNREVPEYPLPTKPPLTYPADKGPDLATLTEYSEKYEDFKFWLYIEDTTISNYVMQSTDNDYYLYRNIFQQKNVSGSLFLDYRNDPERLQGNNIVYGHAMANGTMFGMLNRFRKEEYFDTHQMIYTYSASEVTVWRIFSAYDTTTDNYYIQTYFASDEEYLQFLRTAQSNSLYSTDIVLTSQDDILTLSTCFKNFVDNGRFVVHAVKLGTCPIT